ncbi:hypothetical protein [Desulfobacter postgatei]|uniref:hypothetical protein n=1 Tax=Desulfobacter postgatei TaxID=2293 RepID=UPI002A35F000|nr:hypothetical protein [Desulfobacter postgatei]MDX9962861.1 hypothetical protein [Desulfobacter postgatei]
MIKYFGMLLGLWLALVCAMPAPVCFGDVLFVHNYQSDEYLMGKQESELRVGYTPRAMLVDKQTRYTGSWMKRFFGEVKEQRDTTHFLLEKRQIREIDWYKNKILTLPFENMHHARMLQVDNPITEGTAQIINARYEVAEPVFSITVDPETKTVGGYPCRFIEADLRLETRDLKKSAASITLIRQHLWVSDAVPGADQYDDFHRRLAETLGVEAERLGQLNFLLRYWQGPLDPIREFLIQIKGYPVQNDFFVEAQYVKNTSSPTPAVISKKIKKERMTLSEAKVIETLDESRFAAVGPFSEVTLE